METVRYGRTGLKDRMVPWDSLRMGKSDSSWNHLSSPDKPQPSFQASVAASVSCRPPPPILLNLVKKETPCRLERTSRTHNVCFLHVLPGLKGGFSVFVGCAMSPYSPGSGACADTKGQESSDTEVARGWLRVSHGPVTSLLLPTGPLLMEPLTVTECTVSSSPMPVSHALWPAHQPCPGWAWGRKVPCSQACTNRL